MNDKENGSKACHLAIKLARRVKQHAYAEPKYLGDLMYYGYEESILLMKIVSIWFFYVYFSVYRVHDSMICIFFTLYFSL